MSNDDHKADALNYAMYSGARNVKRNQNQIYQLAYYIALALSKKPVRIVVKDKERKQELIKLLEQSIVAIPNKKTTDYNCLESLYIDEAVELKNN